jgi:hypothetical protein
MPNWRELAAKGFYFIGNSAYAIKSFLIPPFNDVAHSTAEDNFNFGVLCNALWHTTFKSLTRACGCTTSLLSTANQWLTIRKDWTYLIRSAIGFSHSILMNLSKCKAVNWMMDLMQMGIDWLVGAQLAMMLQQHCKERIRGSSSAILLQEMGMFARQQIGLRIAMI